MDDKLGLRMKLSGQSHLLWINPMVHITIAGVKDYSLFALGGNIVSQVLVGDKEYLIVGYRVYYFDSVSRGTATVALCLNPGR